jgi:7-carboxy-7-deazaguanine synthase
MFIAEIFHSIQGEGELTGIPSVFVRTSGCNLRCGWCDTKYASWRPEGEEMSIDEVVTTVLDYSTDYCVLTGGEPMIAKGIHDLAAKLRSAGRHITIETAATVPPAGIACDLASLSPKLSNSAPDAASANGWKERHERTRLQPEVIAQWIEEYDFQLKFVVQSQKDLPEIDHLLALVKRPIPRSKVLLMPEGTDVTTIRGRHDTLIELSKRYCYRYCNRLHIELFGNTRGT